MESSTKTLIITSLVALVVGGVAGYLIGSGGEEEQRVCPWPNECEWPAIPCQPQAAVMLSDIAQWAQQCRDGQRITEELYGEIVEEVNRCLNDCLESVDTPTKHVCDCPQYCQQLQPIHEDASKAKYIREPGPCGEAWAACEEDLEAFPSGRE